MLFVLNFTLIYLVYDLFLLFIFQVEDERVAHIYSVIMLQRLDKRKDRVEISPEQLSDASTQAEVNYYDLNWSKKWVNKLQSSIDGLTL